MANDKTTAPESAICNRMARLLEIAGWRDAADYVRSDYITGKVSDLMPPDLSDPVVVHANMLHGAIAKLTAEQIKHLYPDLAAAHAENQRLTKERDEARAQVAAAYKAAAIRSENYACGAPYNQRASINALANSLRGMTPDDAKAALEAYGLEKVREGMQRASEVAADRCAACGVMEIAGLVKAHILADMEKLK